MKRKHQQKDDVGLSNKKLKKERKHKNKCASSNGEFVLVQASLVVSIPPIFASNPSQGVQEMLDSMVMRYIPPLRGVVLTHSNLQFLQPTATVQGDSPYATCNVGFDATIWSPRVGQRLTGTVNLCSPDHISLLVHRTFNVSIPRHHIPQTEWVFEYGPAENDPEYGMGSASIHETYNFAEEGDREELGIDDAMKGKDTPAGHGDPAVASSGRWVHCITGSSLGGGDATVEFTVVGLTIANQMLSLVGSIQPEPFSPDHVASAQHTYINQHLDSEEFEPKNNTEGHEHKRKENSEEKGQKRKKHAEGKDHKRTVDGNKESKGDKSKATNTERKPKKRKKEGK